MHTLLTIAARGGSKGVKNKNIRPLMGKPLIAYTIMQAKKWGKADRIIVTTDSLEIAAVARDYGVDVPFLRPAELASDVAGKIPALRHALLFAEEFYKTRFDIVVDLDPTAPLRTVAGIEECYQTFLAHRPKTIFSAVAAHKNPYFNMVELDESGCAVLCKQPKSTVLRRQDGPKVYNMNASIYMYQRDYLANENNNTVFTDRSLVHEMDDMSAYDIDREVDFKFLEFIVSQGLFQLEE